MNTNTNEHLGNFTVVSHRSIFPTFPFSLGSAIEPNIPFGDREKRGCTTNDVPSTSVLNRFQGEELFPRKFLSFVPAERKLFEQIEKRVEITKLRSGNLIALIWSL